MNRYRLARRVSGDAERWVPPDGDAPWIMSVGHSDHGLEAFFDLLEGYHVSVLVDVRRRPRSYVSHFDQGALVASCRAHGIVYRHLVDLGAVTGESYAEHMASDAWQRAYSSLRGLGLDALARGGRAAFMCVERDPADCHRRFIARRLESDGWRVVHILPDEAQTRLF